MAITGAKAYRVRINDDAVLILRRPTAQESAKYLATMSRSGQTDATSDFVAKVEEMCIARIEYADQLLIGCENVQYIDDATGEIRELTPEVPGWIAMIDNDWKVKAIMRIFDGNTVELENRRKS